MARLLVQVDDGIRRGAPAGAAAEGAAARPAGQPPLAAGPPAGRALRSVGLPLGQPRAEEQPRPAHGAAGPVLLVLAVGPIHFHPLRGLRRNVEGVLTVRGLDLQAAPGGRFCTAPNGKLAFP